MTELKKRHKKGHKERLIQPESATVFIDYVFEGMERNKKRHEQLKEKHKKHERLYGKQNLQKLDI